jgi:hypothetical protein
LHERAIAAVLVVFLLVRGVKEKSNVEDVAGREIEHRAVVPIWQDGDGKVMKNKSETRTKCEPPTVSSEDWADMVI